MLDTITVIVITTVMIVGVSPFRFHLVLKYSLLRVKFFIFVQRCTRIDVRGASGYTHFKVDVDKRVSQ